MKVWEYSMVWYHMVPYPIDFRISCKSQRFRRLTISGRTNGFDWIIWNFLVTAVGHYDILCIIHPYFLLTVSASRDALTSHFIVSPRFYFRYIMCEQGLETIISLNLIAWRAEYITEVESDSSLWVGMNQLTRGRGCGSKGTAEVAEIRLPITALIKRLCYYKYT